VRRILLDDGVSGGHSYVACSPSKSGGKRLFGSGQVSCYSILLAGTFELVLTCLQSLSLKVATSFDS
jgi:hypothetical protein